MGGATIGRRPIGLEKQVHRPNPVIILPTPMEHQRRVLISPARMKVVAAGRRWGKTIAGLVAVVEGHGPTQGYFKGALQGGHVWWIAPTFGISLNIWRELKKALRGAWLAKYEGEHRIVLPGGGDITVKSADNYDGMRGFGLDGVVMDEYAYMHEEVWPEVIRPALADRQGWAIFISTPRMGPLKSNHFYKLYKMGEEGTIHPSYQSFHGPTSENPYIPTEEIAAAKAELDPLSFRQEFLAEFVTAAGSIVKKDWLEYYETSTQMLSPEGHVVPIITLGTLSDTSDVLPKGYRKVTTYTLSTGIDKNLVSRTYTRDQLTVFSTVDLAASIKAKADFTVVSTFGVTPDGDLLWLDVRRSRLEGPDQHKTIENVFRNEKPGWMTIESVGYQLTLIQALVRKGLAIREFRPDRDKLARFLPLAARYQQSKVWHPATAPWLEDLEDEILSFPESEHDDICDTGSMAAAEMTTGMLGGGPRMRDLGRLTGDDKRRERELVLDAGDEEFWKDA